MPTYLILAAMKGRFVSDFGNTYDNFQMMGYVTRPEDATPFDAVTAFFDQPPYPIQWQDVEYLWAELLGQSPTMRTTGLRPRLCRVPPRTLGRKLTKRS